MTADSIFDPEFVAVIFAVTTGARLFPITTAEAPKHLLPVAGISLVARLVMVLDECGMQKVLIAVTDESKASTVSELKAMEGMVQEENKHDQFVYKESCQVSVHVLPPECAGSAEALRLLPVPTSSHALCLPGDLVVMDTAVLIDLVHRHRIGNLDAQSSTACTMLLANVGEQDAQTGIPLRESQKFKKGGLARDEETIEYIALSDGERVVWKQSKIDVEEDLDITGQAPKLVLPKARLGTKTTVRMDWNDVHAYVLSPWVHQELLTARAASLVSLQGDLLPLLIRRQFKGVKATFGSSAVQDESESPTSVEQKEYAVRAHVVGDGSNKVLRAYTIPSYLYAGRQVVSKAVAITNDKKRNPCVALPSKSNTNPKFNSVILQDARLGEKVTYKSSVVGRASALGAKCRLNNVVIMDNVTVGDNCVLQNSILGRGAQVGENCNLNDCQVPPGYNVPAGTKEKGESFS